MNCPACSTGLLNMFYEGVRVRMCGACNGVFAGQDELKVIVHRQEAEIPRDRGLVSEQGEEVDRNCPRCAVHMQKPRFRKQITLDRCAQCQGIWLDRGELEDVQLIAELAGEPIPEPSAPKSAPLPESAPVPESAPPPASFDDAAGPEMTCPKCQTLQPKAEICRSCGLVIAKFEARAAEEQQSLDRATNRLESVFSRLSGFRVQEYSGIDKLKSVLDGGLRNLSFGEQYDIRDQDGRNILTARQGHLGGVTQVGRGIEVRDLRDELVLTLRWSFKLFASRMEVLDPLGKRVGAIESEFSVLGRKLNVLGLGKTPILEISGPLLKPLTFEVTRNGRPYATIQKRWLGIGGQMVNTRGDEFGAQFDVNVDPKRKALILAATVLIDSLYFDNDDNDD